MKTILKNKKISIVAVVVIAFVASCIVGCQEEENLTVQYSSFEEANITARTYLELRNNQYVLNLSEQQALKLRMSPSDYKRMQDEVSQTNSRIRELLQNSDNSIYLADPQKIDLQNKIPRLKTGVPETSPGSSGTIPDQNPVSFTINVPSGATSVHFDMYSASIIGAGNVTIKDVGSDYFFQFFVFGGNCDINLPMSNTTYTVTVSVSSTFGGSYAYHYVY
jgi:hypothetical protein